MREDPDKFYDIRIIAQVEESVDFSTSRTSLSLFNTLVNVWLWERFLMSKYVTK